MPKRAITPKQRAWLQDQLDLWRRDAIVTEQQAERISDLYEGAFYRLNQRLAEDSALSLAGPPIVLLVVALAVVLLTSRAGAAASVVRRQAIPLGLALLMALLPLLTTALGSTGSLELAALVPTVLVNVAMLAGAFWLMQVGLREDRGRPFGGGVIYFLLWAVLRYVDLFGDFGGMLGAALMFFLCGGALFAVARYWQGRKEVRYA